MQLLHTQLEVGPEPIEVGRARKWVRAQLDAVFPVPDGRRAETLVLLVSELVTNAVVHTGRPAVLRLGLGLPEPGAAGTMRLEVVDGSSRPPQRRSAGGDDTGGRGLELVELLADRWGWHREGSGKRVWCEIDWPAGGGRRSRHPSPAVF
ncbi:ATP-binding protein [Streptomyces sp. ACA25]|uniref:ATP-binding protein n=1 Tax=Streptomyces sp. ACA25 TaxID=3022596 RepID=UPI002307F76C|nr:ATP-binding protein [Streptomyces sp. ACA25]MDB1087142.1 ATP-binding protein [Streptomyces sp. ACA25]